MEPPALPDQPPAPRPGRKPALRLTGTQRPAIAIPQRHTAPVTVSAPAGHKSPPRAASQYPTAEALTAWVDAGDEYALRFLESGSQSRGNIAAADWDYFRSDFASIMDHAALIGETLGLSAPSLAAAVEPDRAACYRRLDGGFAGTYCGPGSSVESLLPIP
jgi:hypothetical protein